jgi:hypothetical protein
MKCRRVPAATRYATRTCVQFFGLTGGLIGTQRSRSRQHGNRLTTQSIQAPPIVGRCRKEGNAATRPSPLLMGRSRRKFSRFSGGPA